jgi:hypothetical protein
MQELVYFLAPLRGVQLMHVPNPEGLRFAATSGYFLSTLRVVTQPNVARQDFEVKQLTFEIEAMRNYAVAELLASIVLPARKHERQ